MVTRVPALVAALLLTGAGCLGPLAGPVDVEIVTRQPGAENELELQVVTVESAIDLARGEGELFTFRAGQTFYSSPFLEQAAYDDRTPEELFEAARGDGSTPDPDLYREDGVIRAREHDSLMYLSSFAHLERAMQFYRDTLDRPSTATERPPVVSFYGGIVASPILPLPVNLSDNAAYFAQADGLFVVPTVLQSEGVAPFFEPGVAVHELSHRVFEHRVFLGGDAVPLWKRATYPAGYADTTSQEDLTRVALNPERRGFNEGIADIHAVGYTRDPDLLGGVSPSGSALRNLEGPLAEVTFRDLVDANVQEDLISGCRLDAGGDNLNNRALNYYCLGTVLAIALWEASDADADVLVAEVLPRVQDGLDLLGERVAERSLESGELTFRTDDGLDSIVRAFAGHPRQADVCAAFGARYADLFAAGGVPSCP